MTVRLEALGDYLGNRHGISVSWTADTGSFSGKFMVIRIQSELVLADSKILVSGQDPGLLWRRKATDYLPKKLSIYLDPETPIDSLPRG